MQCPFLSLDFVIDKKNLPEDSTVPKREPFFLKQQV